MNAPPGYPYPQNPYMQNPYAAPYAAPARIASSLYTAGHVSLATFLGTPLGGSVVLALNEHRLGRQGGAIKALLFGVLGTVFLVALGFILPDGFPSFPFGLGSLLLMGWIARSRQGEAVRVHLASGGRAASGWGAAGIGLLSLLVVFVPLVAILVVVELVGAK